MKMFMRGLRYYPLWLPTALLIIVALTQKYLVYAHNCDPWLAGGFSMFSTVDSDIYRAIQVSPIHASKPYLEPIVVRSRTRDTIHERARHFPSAKNLTAFGERYLRNAKSKMKDVTHARIALNTIAFDSKGPSISRRLLKEVEVHTK